MIENYKDGAVTARQLVSIIGCDMATARRWAGPLSAALERFAINTPERVAAFLAQVAHESGGLRWVRELWGPTAAQRGYEGRHDLGNTQPSDGERFKGRGLIQITGRANYRRCGEALGLPLLGRPELLEEPQHAAMSAAWFWAANGLNSLADAGEFEAITRRINGGTNGAAERREYYRLAQAHLGASDASTA